MLKKLQRLQGLCNDYNDRSFYFNLNFLNSTILTDSKLHKKISIATNLKPTIMC